jgi:hypothetical protein
MEWAMRAQLMLVLVGVCSWMGYGETGSCRESCTNRYDSYHQVRSPIGLLDIEDASARLCLGYRFVRWEDEDNPDSLLDKATGYTVPSLRIGKPEAIVFGMRYTPAVMTLRRDSLTIRLPLHRFGFEIAGQSPSKLIRIGFAAQGSYGKAEPDTGVDQRVTMGVEHLGLYVGSQIHEAVRLGFWGGATARFDSLKDNRALGREDRYFAGALPTIGWYVDIGTAELPVLSNVDFSYSRHHFVYVVKPSGNAIDTYGGLYGTNGNRDAVVTDSLAWNWQTMGDFELGKVVCRPALRLGYRRSAGSVYLPKGDNHPTLYEREREGHDWRLRSFTFGFGGACVAGSYGTAWLEFSRRSLSLDMADSLKLRMDANPDPQVAGQFESSRGLGRFAAGLEAAVHAVPVISLPAWFELRTRFGILTATEPLEYGGYRSGDFALVNEMGVAGQIDRYRPYLVMLGQQRVTNVSFGVGAGFLEGMFEFDLCLGLLRRRVESYVSRSDKGVEFSVDMMYALKRKSPQESRR